MQYKDLDKLEYFKVRDRLKTFCHSELARNLVDKLFPSARKELVVLRLNETKAARYCIEHANPPALREVEDLEPLAKYLERGGVLYNVEDFSKIYYGLLYSRLVNEYLEDFSSEGIAAFLTDKERLFVDVHLEKMIDATFDDNGEVADTASSALRDIRRKISIEEEKWRNQAENLAQSKRLEPYLQEKIVVQRYGAYCLSVKAGASGAVPGTILDRSASGSTLYIEPHSLSNIRRALEKLQAEETEEVQRILLQLSKKITPHAAALAQSVEALGHLDFCFAKGRLSYDQKAIYPQLLEEPAIQLQAARHPLLDAESVVPIDVSLGTSYDTLIITGPNTGGKTVALKTTGLLIAMCQAGLWIPAAEESSIGIFSHVLTDIGDEQSIEQSLSTFSSHMYNIKNLLPLAETRTLVLLDELGAGTDPAEGGALAIAIIEAFRQRKAKILATTHYSVLKKYAVETQGVENASVSFDIESLSPTYHLMIGVAGQSNAFAITRRIGLEEHIVAQAEEILETQKSDTDKLLQALDDKQQEAEHLKQTYEKALQSLQEKQEKIDADVAHLEKIEENILKKAKDRATSILDDARKDADEMIQTVKRLQKQSAVSSASLQEIRAQRKGLVEKSAKLRVQQEVKKPNAPLSSKDIKIGMDVYVPKFDQKGTILALPNKKQEVQVQLGLIKTTVKVNDLERAAQIKSATPKAVARVKTKPAFSPTLDLRGMRAVEAEVAIDKFLDDAFLSGLSTVEIIHGKGTGVLREVAQTVLAGHPHVESTRLGNANEGGDGISIVVLRSN